MNRYLHKGLVYKRVPTVSDLIRYCADTKVIDYVKRHTKVLYLSSMEMYSTSRNYARTTYIVYTTACDFIPAHF